MLVRRCGLMKLRVKIFFSIYIEVIGKFKGVVEKWILFVYILFIYRINYDLRFYIIFVYIE